ncbi:hypothetical protein FSARC_12214 [Fusarium sarcochroum]|uniref:Apple domain-containing protein n=1 Tax=Fusarium sarcochroum TaxID=1208366 RepID=A0A8H4WX65_9HYPO|nr:hypothetical protein FSARC_12214 [Fusarium sarcochroum]
MIGSKVLVAVLTTASFWAVDAGKCKPHPNQTSLLTISDTSTAASSATGSDVQPSTEAIESTESVGAEFATSGDSSVTISHQPTIPGSLNPTTSSTSLTYSTISIDSTSSSYETTPHNSATSGSFTTEADATVSVDPTISTDSTISIDTAVSSYTASTEIKVYDSSTTVDSATTSTDTFTSTETTHLTYPTALTDTTATTDTTTSSDITTTLVTSVSTSGSTTTESFWTSTTEASCPIISSSIEDPGFEGDNSGTNKWEYMLSFSGVPVPFQKKSSPSQDVPRANSGNQFALLSSGSGSTVGSDMWRPISLNPTKKYQIWFTFAAVSSPNEDWSFAFQVSTWVHGPVYKETIAVPKGSPFKYLHGTAIFQGAAGDHLYAITRASSVSAPRLVAVDDIYVAEYEPSCAVPTEPTDLCGGTQGSPPNSPYRLIQMNQGSVEMCAQACLSDDNCVVFGWVVEQYFKACYLSKISKEDMKISVRTDGRGTRFYDRSCGQCSGLECLPYSST